MKIVALYAAMPGCEYGLGRGFKIVTEIFEELGEPVETINLAFLGIPYYDGLPVSSVQEIMKTIEEADSVIFAFAVHLDSPCALMETFMEHFAVGAFSQVLRDKNCLLIAASKDGGERQAMEHVSTVLGLFGAFDAVRIISSDYAFTPIAGLRPEQTVELIERQTEDYYKILRQNRRFIIPILSSVVEPSEPYEPPALNENEKKRAMDDLHQKYGKSTDAARENDIEDITRRYVSQYTKTASGISYAGTTPIMPVRELQPQRPAAVRDKSCRQLTQSLPHNFNPQNAVGMRAVFQISVNGSETFEGYLTIDNSSCTFDDGAAESPDIVILAEEAAWTEILKGRSTAQKAFMVGRIKVRGNFMLLAKFDALFDV